LKYAPFLRVSECTLHIWTCILYDAYWISYPIIMRYPAQYRMMFNMDEILHRLEKRLKSLITQHNQLKQVNDELNENKFVLAREREMLLTKQMKAISQIEMLVS